jgi:hypothetical protein
MGEEKPSPLNPDGQSPDIPERVESMPEKPRSYPYNAVWQREGHEVPVVVTDSAGTEHLIVSFEGIEGLAPADEVRLAEVKISLESKQDEKVAEEAGGLALEQAVNPPETEGGEFKPYYAMLNGEKVKVIQHYGKNDSMASLEDGRNIPTHRLQPIEDGATEEGKLGQEDQHPEDEDLLVGEESEDIKKQDVPETDEPKKEAFEAGDKVKHRFQGVLEDDWTVDRKYPFNPFSKNKYAIYKEGDKSTMQVVYEDELLAEQEEVVAAAQDQDDKTDTNQPEVDDQIKPKFKVGDHVKIINDGQIETGWKVSKVRKYKKGTGFGIKVEKDGQEYPREINQDLLENWQIMPDEHVLNREKETDQSNGSKPNEGKDDVGDPDFHFKPGDKVQVLINRDKKPVVEEWQIEEIFRDESNKVRIKYTNLSKGGESGSILQEWLEVRIKRKKESDEKTQSDKSKNTDNDKGANFRVGQKLRRRYKKASRKSPEDYEITKIEDPDAEGKVYIHYTNLSNNTKGLMFKEVLEKLISDKDIIIGIVGEDRTNEDDTEQKENDEKEEQQRLNPEEIVEQQKHKEWLEKIMKQSWWEKTQERLKKHSERKKIIIGALGFVPCATVLLGPTILTGVSLFGQHQWRKFSRYAVKKIGEKIDEQMQKEESRA